ncbi:uncharacterized protein TRIADDRAFT_54690 [Trichoplax adhaerens]|uniref:Uncharacterized protein n=1 Tax=Trichoplax adhaerens TaxID=10228 RepID=B3RSQ4_TRIAD|nr:predicted protein [Trichoplax adhaerens]EDV27094.1 predicted protein [Trichoplax adhaerens]|eukprot:XP_002111090.1 predicted protein [Trichoplax adhaerens]
MAPQTVEPSLQFHQRLLTIGLITGVLGVNQGRLAVENSLAAILEDKNLELDQISIGKLLAWGLLKMSRHACKWKDQLIDKSQLSSIAALKLEHLSFYLALIT